MRDTDVTVTALIRVPPTDFFRRAGMLDTAVEKMLTKDDPAKVT